MTNTYIAPGEATPEAMIEEVEKGFYAVSFAGGQVDPATGDFVFGVSEGYLIEGGRVTRPCRGATLIGNCLDALRAIDAVGDDFFMKTGICGKGGQKVPVGTGQGHVRLRALTVGGRSGDGALRASQRAVEAAQGVGAEAAEAYASHERNREVRVHGGEVESLTAAAQSGVGVRAWIGARVGYAYGTDLSTAGVEEIAARAVGRRPRRRRGRVRDAAGFRRRSRRWRESATPASRAGRPTAPPSWRWPSSARPSTPTPAWSVSRRRSTPTLPSRSRSPPRAGVAGEYEASSCFAYLQALAEGEGARETGLGFGLGRGPADLDPAAIGREGGERAAAMIGAVKPQSRACPVVLDPTVAASFAGLVGGVLTAASVQRGRSPFAGRLGEELATPAFALHDDGRDPEGAASAPFDGEGVPRRRTALIEDGRLQAYLYDTYTARREGSASTGNASRHGYRSLPSVSPSNLVVAPGESSFEQLLGAADDGVFVTDVAGLHSGVNPVTGVFSVGASGRAIRGGELAEPLREFTIAGDLIALLGSVRSAGAEARWVPFGGSVRTPPLLISEIAVSGS